MRARFPRETRTAGCGRFFAGSLAIGLLGLAGGAAAQGAAPATPAPIAPGGEPVPWQMGLPAPATGVMDFVKTFHDWTTLGMAAICVFVLALLIIVAVRFNERAHPTPTKTAHNTLLEVAWTLVPVLILVAIAIPSFRLLRYQLVPPEAEVTVKAIGKQWLWAYEYPRDQGGFTFASNMLQDSEIKDPVRQPRLLAVDNELVVPVNRVVKVQVTAADVIHQFAVPAFGIKILAIPGRLNETWFRAEREGVYYGQCHFICGTQHSGMPVAVRVVSDAEYAEFVRQGPTRFEPLQAALPATPAATSRRDVAGLGAAAR